MQSAAFWDAYHRSVPANDWYCDPELAIEQLQAIKACFGLAASPRAILHVGSGTSMLGDLLEHHDASSADETSLVRDGSAPARPVVVNVDFAPECTTLQQARRPSSIYETRDVTDSGGLQDLCHRNGCRHSDGGLPGFDLVVDKGTLDALLQRESDPAAVADGAVAVQNLLRCVPRCGAPAASYSGLVLVFSIIGPDKRWPFFMRQLEAATSQTVHESTCEPACSPADTALARPSDVGVASGTLAVPECDDCPPLCAGQRITPCSTVLAAAATSDGSVRLIAALVEQAPLEIPEQPGFYIYAAHLRGAALRQR
jgi:hypothetical protein